MSRVYQKHRGGLGLLVLVLSGCVLCKRADPGAGPANTAATASTVAPPLTPRPPASALWTTNTFAVVAGVLAFESPSLAPFSSRMRKDRELHERLVERGVPPDHMRLLLDQAVTAATVREALTQIARRADAGSTLLFYYAGHGMRDGEGKPFFAAYDTGDDLGSTGISLEEVATLLKTNFRGSRVLLMADCCYSGSLRNVAQALSEAGLQAVSLTSADASNVSTANWTFTQSVIDALRGDPLLDRNRDGTITLGEVDQEVADAMKYRERQRHGFFAHGVPAKVAWSKASPSPTLTQGPHSRGAYLEAKVDGHWQTVRVVEAGSAQSVVRLYDYCESRDLRVASSSLREIGFKHYPVGAKIRVYWGGKIWPAEVTGIEDDFHKITYPGWPSYWDEWVLSNRIEADEESGAANEKVDSEKVDVEWQGSWYPAVVMQRSGERALIHYEGYASSWDEWVGPQRIRRRR